MQIEFSILDTEWKPLSNFVVVEDDVTYRIQNRGADFLLALEAASTPSDSVAGVLIPPYSVLYFKRGTQDLYLRAFSSKCEANIYSEV